MALAQNHNLTDKYKLDNVYSIALDVSGWDKITFQAIGAVTAAVYIYGTNNGGDLTGIRDGNAELATDWSNIQAVNLATGSAVSSFSAAGLYRATVDAQYMKVSGGNIYQIRAEFWKQS